MRDLPEYDENIECENPLCIYGEATAVTGLHGVIGGGLGPYTTCSLCGTVLTKSYDKDLCDSHVLTAEELKARKDEAIEQGTEIADVEDNQAGGTTVVGERTGGSLPGTRK